MNLSSLWRSGTPTAGGTDQIQDRGEQQRDVYSWHLRGVPRSDIVDVKRLQAHLRLTLAQHAAQRHLAVANILRNDPDF